MRPADLFFPLTLCLLLQLCAHQAAASDGPAVSPAKRKPGWGKRQTDWSYVDPTLAKRKPGWGKREFPVLRGRSDSADWDTNALDDVVSDQIAKRRPGWGKRQVSWSNMDSSLAKRKPGWGKRDGAMDKRVPGWGRRSGPSDVIETLKRKPGWGKRSGFESVSKQVPGDNAFESYMEKRKPGWGKRKGTFSDVSDKKCRDLEKDADYFIHKAVEEKNMLEWQCE